MKAAPPDGKNADRLRLGVSYKRRKNTVKHFLGRVCGVMIALILLLAASAAAEYAPLPVDDSPGPAVPQENYLPDDAGYQDESISVRIEEIREYDTTILVAYVDIKHPSQIRTSMADRYGTKRTAIGRVLSKRSNAVLAVNGDFFSFHSEGYLVRQGVLYRDRTNPMYDILIIDDKGDFHIIIDPTEEAAHGFEGNIVNSFNFGPALVVDGEIITTTKEMNVGLDKPTQRMGIAQLGPLSYMCVATEGPENKGSVGLTIPEFAQLMKDLGAKTAYNLDGGSSSAMMLNDKKINALSTGKNRPICDILYFATLVQ